MTDAELSALLDDCSRAEERDSATGGIIVEIETLRGLVRSYREVLAAAWDLLGSSAPTDIVTWESGRAALEAHRD